MDRSTHEIHPPPASRRSTSIHSLAALGLAAALGALPAGGIAWASPGFEPTSDPGAAKSALELVPMPDEVLPEELVETCGRCTDCSIERVTIAPKGSIWSALDEAGVAKKDIAPAIAAMKKVANMRALRPGTELVVKRDADGKLMSIERRPSPTISQCVERDEKGKLAARTFELEVSTIPEELEVELGPTRPIEVAFEELGEHPLLAFRVREILAAWGDRAQNAFAYDRLRVVIEKRSLEGEVLGYGEVLAVEYLTSGGRALRAFWYTPRDGEGGYYDENGEALGTATIGAPLETPVITSRFGVRKSPFRRRAGRSTVHFGLDFHAHRGTPIYAARAGVVERARRQGGYGHCVVIAHEHGLETRYAHLSKYAKGIQPGVWVEQGELIGYSGNTGFSTGPHLHFETMIRGHQVDPEPLLGAATRPLTAEERPAFQAAISGLRLLEEAPRAPSQEVATLAD
ncbi:M23 family metallopeptidase [Myxococcota bacterium]|nr:M23 family metallopeptidase [Myxococcota bacterium]